jgi:hypothetical protein
MLRATALLAHNANGLTLVLVRVRAVALWCAPRPRADGMTRYVRWPRAATSIEHAHTCINDTADRRASTENAKAASNTSN